MPLRKVPQSSIGELLLCFKRKIHDSGKNDSFKNELSFSQLEVLWFIGLDGRKRMEEIAKHLKVTPPSATVLIEKMKRLGFVKRENDPKDRRIVYISIQEKMKKQLEVRWAEKEKVLNRLVSKLSTKDRKDFERIMRILIEE